ncbi:hypothetical protein BSKO_00295 [Bryopsis sp. KO-2023]|nr:hypothetical protein BSKO_00295 [Bryopsis sp. KO-2023]
MQKSGVLRLSSCPVQRLRCVRRRQVGRRQQPIRQVSCTLKPAETEPPAPADADMKAKQLKKNDQTVAGESSERDDALDFEAIKDDPRMLEVYDQLIQLFKGKPRGDWKKLIAISKQWPMLATGVFDRIDALFEEETDPGTQLGWREFRKALLNVHTEVSRYDEILVQFISSKTYEWDAIVAANREHMTPGFFEHLNNLIAAGKDDPEEQERLKEISTVTLALLNIYEQAAGDERSLQFARESLMDILQSGSLEEADRRMDELASSGGLDGAMMLTMATMYSAVKESPYTKDEVKQIMYHLYLKSKEQTEAQQPPVVRILKYLLQIEDPSELRKALDDAFTPGEFPSAELDYLSTRPSDLMRTINAVLSTFEEQKGKHTMLGQATGTMNPEVIQKLRKLEVYIRKEYM